MIEIYLSNTPRSVSEGRHPTKYSSRRSLDSRDRGEFSSLELYSLLVSCAILHFALLTRSFQRKTENCCEQYMDTECYIMRL